MDIVEEITNQSLKFDDTISLDFEARFKRKIKLVSDSGYEFFLSLDKSYSGCRAEGRVFTCTLSPSSAIFGVLRDILFE